MKKSINLFVVLCLVTLIIGGCSKTEEKSVQKTAEDFVTELYTVDSKEIENYNNLLSLETIDPQVLAEAIESNDVEIKSLMTEKAYKIFAQNRQNFKFADYCIKGNYTMQVIDISLSERTPSTDEDSAGYNFEAKIKFISISDKTELIDIGKGIIELSKENEQWKISGYKEIEVPKTIIK